MLRKPWLGSINTSSNSFDGFISSLALVTFEKVPLVEYYYIVHVYLLSFQRYDKGQFLDMQVKGHGQGQ